MAEVVARCARCHRVVPPGVTNCPRDGTRIERPEPPPPPPPPEPGGRLLPALTVDLVVSSPRGERRVQLDSGETLDIGREVGPLTDLCPDNVSGRHARICVGDDVVIEDVGSNGGGSTNGTYLNGARLPANRPTRLAGGAVVTCGTQPPLTIRVEVTRL